ncbi:sensor histidine kinase [Acinetobacter sp. Marseille-Q1618]|uniref:sensor histidine kinase n=1 Tax=Acinetobacter sp. Marseille-Q1618 TaxID=2697502 RepID=UPI00156FEDE9|nr:ATP-binding protein [Acinetobacter sp. Marseille-Q1618]
MKMLVFNKTQLNKGLGYFTFLLIVLIIFICDTTTDYDIAISVFYNIVIYLVGHQASKKRLIYIFGLCVFLTIISMLLTPFGNYKIGIINMLISILSMMLLTSLMIKKAQVTTLANEFQARLIRISRIKSLEGTTESIVHEINQPLTAIRTSSHSAQLWLEQNPPNTDRALKAIQRIDHDSQRISHIIRRVHRLTKAKQPELTHFDFNQAVHEILTLSLNDLEKNKIRLNDQLSQTKIYAYADEIQIQQVIHNLITNAIDALKNNPIAQRQIELYSNQQTDKIVFSIVDNGHGVEPEQRQHIFETFWSSKEEGIGIGLSICLTIIEANHGHLNFKANPKGGAIFSFDIPAAKER